MTAKEPEEKSTIYCSFCGKSQHEVRKLIAGPTVFICDECVGLCVGLVREAGFNVMPLEYSDEERAMLLAAKVPSILRVLLLGGLKIDDEANMTGEKLLSAIAHGLYLSTTPEGQNKARQLEIEELRAQMRTVAAPAREALKPLRDRLRQLVREDASD